MNMRKHIFKTLIAAGLWAVALTSCEKDEYKVPDPVSALTNDCIKRTLGPNIASLPIEFVYAMAIPKSKGKLAFAEVKASIPGAPGTYLEHRSFYTNSSGVDVPVTVGTPSVTDGASTKMNFTVDTSAASLRFFYIVPNEARGKQVKFTFSVTASDGSTAYYEMGPYDVSKMEIKRNIAVSNNNLAFLSIADMTAYNAASAATNAAKIDLVYLFRTTPAVFTHGLVAPGADAALYLPGVTLPSGVNNATKVIKVFSLQDRNLAQMQFGIYVDDIDMQKVDFSTAPNHAIGLRAENGVWVETADKKYRAYVFVNSINAAGTAVVSMLRYDTTEK